MSKPASSDGVQFSQVVRLDRSTSYLANTPHTQESFLYHFVGTCSRGPTGRGIARACEEAVWKV